LLPSDRQRLAGSISAILSYQANLKIWYLEHTWPKLLNSQCGVWDYRVLLRQQKHSQHNQHSGVVVPPLVRTLVQFEEHLFSRKRRFCAVVERPRDYDKKSYRNFSQHRIQGESCSGGGYWWCWVLVVLGIGGGGYWWWWVSHCVLFFVFCFLFFVVFSI
jgi:hypothetical protein